MPRAKKNVEVTENKVSIYEFKEETLGDSAKIKYMIPYSEIKSLCDSVVDFCFADSDYNPCGKEIILRCYICLYYTNITYSELEELENFCVSLYFDRIVSGISPIQYKDIRDSIDELIDFRKQKILKSISSNTDDVIQNVNNLIMGLQGIGDKFGKFIEDINVDDMKKLIPGLLGADENVEEEKVVEAAPKKPARKKSTKVVPIT